VSDVQYRPVPGFPGYVVGDDGSVWAVMFKNKPPRRLLPSVRRQTRWGMYYHLTVMLSAVGGYREGVPRVARSFQLGRVILETFVGPPPPGAHVWWKDGDALNCRLDNLSWRMPYRQPGCCGYCGEPLRATPYARDLIWAVRPAKGWLYRPKASRRHCGDACRFLEKWWQGDRKARRVLAVTRVSDYKESMRCLRRERQTGAAARAQLAALRRWLRSRDPAAFRSLPEGFGPLGTSRC
jgi:hypothetical protein